MRMIRSYSELVRLSTFEERFEYLRLSGKVGAETFGRDRYLNQRFYQHNPRWRRVRDQVIIRDDGNDLAVDGMGTIGSPIVHHLNPLTVEDVEKDDPLIYNLENLVVVSHPTHLAIHYGDPKLLPRLPLERAPGDTCPWK